MEGYTQGLESSSDTKQQEQGKIFRQALMLLASPNGIALTTPENIILQASQDIAESASGSINLSAQKYYWARTRQNQFVRCSKGLRAYAAKGKLELQAQDDAIEAIAKKVIKLISTEDKIELTSPKEIVLTAGGSQLKINANGVFSTTGGKFESKAGQHLFTSGAKVSYEVPQLPSTMMYSNKLDVYDLFWDFDLSRLSYVAKFKMDEFRLALWMRMVVLHELVLILQNLLKFLWIQIRIGLLKLKKKFLKLNLKIKILNKYIRLKKMNTELKHKLYNITFTLHDLTHKPIPNLYYEIKNGKDLVKKVIQMHKVKSRLNTWEEIH